MDLRRILARVGKGARLLRRPAFAAAVLREGVAAAVEHLEPIDLGKARTLIDIGANKGQFSLAFRSRRPDAAIIAFEPLPKAADRFERLFARDTGVTLHRTALSEKEGEAQFHVANRPDSSSLLKPGVGQEAAFAVHSATSIQVPVRRLDQCVTLANLARPILLKIDVQGAELGVLRGCDDLESVDYVYVELSYVELYEGQSRLDEVFAYLNARNFVLAGVYNQVTTARFGPTQADFLFKNLGPQPDGAPRSDSGNPGRADALPAT